MIFATKEYKDVTILLPVMDETYSLKKTADTVINSCVIDDIAEIILLLCERTTGDSKIVAERLVEEYSDRVSIFIHMQKLPFVGGAIREGINMAKGSHVIMMSSDLETDPTLVPVFIEKAKEFPNKIITASRWKRGGGFKGYNKVKLICNLFFERMIGVFYFSTLSDLTYAFRIFPTKLMQSIEWQELKHPFFLETALKPLRLGVEFVEVPAHWIARTEGTSQNSFLANFAYFKTAWNNRFIKKSRIVREDVK